MKLTITEKSMPVFEYIKAHEDEDITAADIAIGMGIADPDDEQSVKDGVKSINGVVTAGLQKKGYTKRIPATIEVDGVTKQVKFIVLTEEGKNYDHAAAQKADAEAAAAKAA